MTRSTTTDAAVTATATAGTVTAERSPEPSLVGLFCMLHVIRAPITDYRKYSGRKQRNHKLPWATQTWTLVTWADC